MSFSDERRRLLEDNPSARSATEPTATGAVTRAETRPSLSERRIEQRLTVVSPGDVKLPQAGLFVLPTKVAKRTPIEIYISFALGVALPIILATVYFIWFASPQYVAEFRFTVKEATSSASPIPGGGLMGLLSGGVTNSPDNYIVTDFLSSREAIEELQRRVDVVTLYSKPTIDWWTRFDDSEPVEKFVPYWQGMLTARYDQITGIASAEVRAFSPEDALLIANTLVSMSEELVNRIANRSAKDAVRFAEQEVAKAEDRLKAARAQMTDYRNRTGVIDPVTSVAGSNSALTQALKQNLSNLETQYTSLQRQNLAPNAPVMISLSNQIKAIKEQLAATEASVGKGRDGAPLSSIIAEYEQLELERQFAQNMVTSTMQVLEQARANASQQHLYITPYVKPSLPQSALYPRPFKSILGVAIFAFIFWVCALLIVRSIRERFA